MLSVNLSAMGLVGTIDYSQCLYGVVAYGDGL